MSEFSHRILEFAQVTTARIGEQLLQDFGQAEAIEKSDGTLVTASDQWADRQLQQAISAEFPEHGFLSEESNHQFAASEWCWVVDPIDGTTNFSHGIPIWGISIALFYQGSPMFGYVHLPPIRQSFHGFWPAGSALDRQLNLKGAFLNQRPIQTSTADPGRNQLFNFCSRSVGQIQADFPCKARMLGGAAYNMLSVASGTMLGCIEQSPKIWDIAAVWVIAQAAGAAWIRLDNLAQDPLFPLIADHDYGQQAYPTLLVSKSELVSVFQPYFDWV